MRIYYVFLINDEIYRKTKKDPYGLYKTLENIYFMSSNEAILGKKVFDKLVVNIDKNNIDSLIKSIHKNNMNYITSNHTHVLNDFFTNESTKMLVTNIYIKIKSSSIFPTFLKDIKNIKNAFVCDFINLDYFYLKETVLLSN